MANVRPLFLITVEHGGHTSAVPVPADEDVQSAAYRMALLKKEHERHVLGSPIADVGTPIYRLWKMVGSDQKEDFS